MKRSIAVFAGAAGLAVVGTLLLANTEKLSAPPSRDRAALVARGEYLVNGVGLCNDCHSPHGPTGELVPGMKLKGSPIPFAPTVPFPAWANAAPPIAGLPAGWTEEQMTHFLMSGERPHNLPSTRPPMPPYRMNRDDAEAVSAYIHAFAAASN